MTTTLSPIPNLLNPTLLVLGALDHVYDPELGYSIAELDLVRQVIPLSPDGVEIQMVLTTPFCPYAAQMLQEIQTAVEEALARPDGGTPPVKVTVLAERWDPPDFLRW